MDVLVLSEDHGLIEAIGSSIEGAGSVRVATGGCGQLYRETTNREIATGDGHDKVFTPRGYAAKREAAE